MELSGDQKLTYFVKAGSTMMTSTVKTFIDVDLAENTNSTMRAGTFERVHQIVTNAVVLTRIRIAIIYVEFGIFTLVTFRTNAVVGAKEILT